MVSSKLFLLITASLFVIVLLVGLSGVKMTGFAVKQYSYSTKNSEFYIVTNETINKLIVETSAPSSFLVTTENGCSYYANENNIGNYPIYAQKNSANRFVYYAKGQTGLCLIVVKEGPGANTIKLFVQ